jgi:hypothetical protein
MKELNSSAFAAARAYIYTAKNLSLNPRHLPLLIERLGRPAGESQNALILARPLEGGEPIALPDCRLMRLPLMDGAYQVGCSVPERKDKSSSLLDQGGNNADTDR